MKRQYFVLVFVTTLALLAQSCNMPVRYDGPPPEGHPEEEFRPEEHPEEVRPEEHPEEVRPEEQPMEEHPPEEGGEAEIAYFSTPRTTLNPGECTALEWNVVGAPGATLNGEPVESSGMREVCPNGTTTYRLTVDLGDRILEREVTITVEGNGEQQPAPQQAQPTQSQSSQSSSQSGCAGKPVISSFVANPSTIAAGGSVTLSWGGVTNGTTGPLVGSVTLEPGFGEVGSPGSRVVKPTKTTTYTLKGTGCGGTTTKQVTVTVSKSGGSTNTGLDLGINQIYAAASGKIMIRIRNAGGVNVNNNIKVSCQALYTTQSGNQVWPPFQNKTITISLAPGQTADYETGYARDPSMKTLEVQCQITPPAADTNSGNDKSALVKVK
jgi:hypothetical protein